MTSPGDEHPPKTVDISQSSGPLPQRIGRYTIQGVIASGGMGTVYKAVQESPRRAVAVKVMRTGVASSSELRRFEFEAQLLGRLRHPGIAQIYEAGTHTEGGASVPFFAMEYIPNAKSITQHAKEKNLGTRDCLDLFARVCDAVHHGHQKGIIHRDLKPGNILVGPNGNPRVIDFGVARATDSDMALTLQQTDVGQLVGTVQYMSPEQCQADPHDLDTRSDVYSLGIVLYELLCKQLPYDISRTPIFEATRVIREESPARPSSINSRLRGDLETIVLKALEKDRDRRYQSAVELAQDLRRYLSGDAIAARPASALYELQVFARRNRGLLAAVTTVAVVVLAGLIVSTALYMKGQSAAVRAAEQEAKALGANNYLQDVMSAVNPMFGDQVRVSELLDTFGAKIEDRFADQPEVEANVRMGLAQSYFFLTMLNGGAQSIGFAAKAEEHLDRALQLRKDIYGENSTETLEVLETFAYFLGLGLNLPRAESMRREALKIREATNGSIHPETVSARESLASLLARRGKHAESETLLREVLDHWHNELGEDDPATLSTRSSLARVRGAQGHLEEAESMQLELLEAARRLSGPGSEAEADALTALAATYVAQGRLDEAHQIYGETQPIETAALGLTDWLFEDAALRTEAPTLLVFWEPWCPYSQAYLPGIEQLYSANEAKPVQMIGMTSLNRGMTEDAATAFVQRNELSFPNAVYDGAVFEQLGFTGWPAVVALQGGSVVWKGHPDKVTAAFLDGLAGKRPGVP